MISDCPDSTWLQAIRDALWSLGELQVVPEHEALERIKFRSYSLILIDASSVDGDMVRLVVQLHKERPTVPIIVATTSPTWQRARQIFLAGATDYIRRSLDKEKILLSFQEILERSTAFPPS